jgi:hypothetical protein
MSIGGFPRGCGVTVQGTEAIYALKGLSPRMWGYRDAGGEGGWGEGSIPACARLPAQRPETSCRGRVYPRAYGATLPVNKDTLHGWGLSPRMWGYRHGEPGRRGHTRSIPVCTGLPGWA